MTNHEPVTRGKAARVVRLFSLMMFRLGIHHEITYWFWKILVFPGRPLFPGAAVPAESPDALPGPGLGPGSRAVCILKRG